jgi:hypothetical protein
MDGILLKESLYRNWRELGAGIFVGLCAFVSYEDDLVIIEV